MSTPAIPHSPVQSSSTRLLARFRTVRAASLALTAPLSPEDLMVQSCPEASPAKWHLAHTTWFFETFVLRDFLAGYRDFHPDFHWLFNSYYNSLGDMPAKSLRASFSRPPLADIPPTGHMSTRGSAACSKPPPSFPPMPRQPAASSSVCTMNSSTRSSSPPTSSTPFLPTPSTPPIANPPPLP